VNVGTPTFSPVNTGIPEQWTTPYTPVVMHNAQVQTSEDFNPDQKCVSSKCQELHSHVKEQAQIHSESQKQTEVQLAAVTTQHLAISSENKNLQQSLNTLKCNEQAHQSNIEQLQQKLEESGHSYSAQVKDLNIQLAAVEKIALVDNASADRELEEAEQRLNKVQDDNALLRTKYTNLCDRIKSQEQVAGNGGKDQQKLQLAKAERKAIYLEQELHNAHSKCHHYVGKLSEQKFEMSKY
jgi:chromosome segregation ATPase